jgi:hypothetical protein
MFLCFYVFGNAPLLMPDYGSYVEYDSGDAQDLQYYTVGTRVASHLFTGSLAGIGELPALAGWYIRYTMYGSFCTVRFGGSSIL